MDRAFRGLLDGALVGICYFTADALGAFAAIGSLFDATVDGILLLLLTATVCCVLGMLVFAPLARAFPTQYFRLRSRKWAVLGLAAVVVFVASYLARRDRDHGLAPAGNPPEDATPVLFIVADTLRADDFYGSAMDFPLAPEAERFAKSAFVFKDAESTAGWTIPSMAAVLTGVHNATFDASAGHLPGWGVTVAEHLRSAGYETRAIVDNVILEPRNGFAQGFESFDQRSAFRFAFTFPAFRLLPTGVHEWLRGVLSTSYSGAPSVVRRAQRRIEKARGDNLFLYVHFMDPHAPYDPHEQHPEKGKPVGYHQFRDYFREGAHRTPSAAELAWLRNRYGGEIRFLDRSLGRLLNSWYARYGDRGLIVFTSDHGEEFVDHGGLSHGMTVHREMVHVPLMIAAPESSGCSMPRSVATPVSLLDLTPTILDFVGAKSLADTGPPIQGRTWVDWLCADAEAPERPLFARQSRYGKRTFRVRQDDEVVVQTLYFDDADRKDAASYNLKSDPREQRSSPVSGRLMQRFNRVVSAFEGAYDPDEPSESERVEESLRALGYIE